MVVGLLALVQAAPALAASSSDLSVTKVGPPTVAPNIDMTYSVTRTNNGTAVARTFR
jgi:hypothetical protein